MPVNGGRESSLMLRPAIGPNGEIKLYCGDEDCPCLPEDGKRLVFTIPAGCEFATMDVEDAATEHVRQAYADTKREA